MAVRKGFRNFAWIVLVYNLAVIAWGAYVRATGSGAGCGAHWPTCQGEVIPRAPQIETLIEFSHRLSSGLVLLLAVAVFVWAWRVYPRRHAIRRSASLVLFFTITEALVGAGLVLFGLVADNPSGYRALAMITHLINTFLLLGALSLTAWWATTGAPERLIWHGRENTLLLLGLFGLLVLGATGAVAALGDTLFPSATLEEALQQDLSPASHLLIRLRVIHPFLAISMGVYIAGFATWLRSNFSAAHLKNVTLFVIGVFVVQLAIGVVNVALLAPVPIQLLHLLTSDLIWIGSVLMAGIVFGTPVLAHRLRDEEVHHRVDQVAGEMH